MAAHAIETPQDVAQVTPEHASIRVEFIDDHVLQIFEQLRPARMVRQDPRMHHVGIAQHHVRAAADRTARILGGIAVVGKDADVAAAFGADEFGQLMQFRELVLREGFGREQIQRARGRVLQDRVHHRHVVAERFA